jgi:N6-adenosine-specific RNA methylase IME4
MKLVNLTIDFELKNLLPPLTEIEYKNLETDCVENGIKEPIIVWKNIIIDGHNRYSIAQKHKLTFTTKIMDFKSRKEVKNWIIKNQLSRRNLTNEARSYFIGVLYRSLKQNKINNLKSNINVKNLPVDTAQMIGDTFSLSSRTIRNNLDIANIIDRIGGINPKIKNEILQGTKPINKTDLLKMVSFNDDDLRVVMSKLEKRRNIHLAIKALNQKNVRENIIREAREKETKNNSFVNIHTTKKRYRVIYIDPPFNYEFDTPAITNSKDHYPTMSVEAIKTLPVSRIAEKNCVLFFWTPSPFIEKSLDIIKHWKFSYKSMFIWDKMKHNIGHYNSVRHEILLLATKGGCLPDTNKLYPSIMSIKRHGRHSEKPEEFRQLIDKMFISGNKIELFARKKVKKWDHWGYEV